MPDAKRYTGGCHCGAVRYEATTALEPVISCNCSHCSARGLLLTFIEPPQFRLLAGESDLVDYQFNKKIIHHLFCRFCGVESFARGKRPDGVEMVAINVRCLEGVDPSAVTTVPFDGKSRR